MYGPSTRRQRASGGGIKTEALRYLVAYCNRNKYCQFEERIRLVILEEDDIVRAWEYMRKALA